MSELEQWVEEHGRRKLEEHARSLIRDGRWEEVAELVRQDLTDEEGRQEVLRMLKARMLLAMAEGRAAAYERTGSVG